MRLQDRPGPPGPYATPDEIPPPVPDPSTGGTRYAGIEYARVMGYRPLRMDLVLPATASGLVPAVVWIHGGIWRFGSPIHGAVTEPACRALIDRGIAVARVEYRFSGEALFPACLHDVKAAVRWLRRFGTSVGVDGAAIGVAVAWYLPTDFLAMGPDGTGAAPILLVHGLEDDLVPPQQSALLHEALQAVGA